MFRETFAFDRVLCWDIPNNTDKVYDNVELLETLYGIEDDIYSGSWSMFDNSPGRLCDDRDQELKQMKSENAELRAIVENLQGWKQKVRHGTDKLSTHKISNHDEDAHLRGSNEANMV